MRRVGRRRNRRIALLVADRRARCEGEGNDAGPDRQRVVRGIVLRRADANLRGYFREWQTENARGFQFFFVGLASIVPASAKYFFGEGTQRFEFLFRRIDTSSFAEGDDGAVIHGVVKDGAGQNEAIRKSYCDAHGNAIAYIAQHAAGCGTVKINRITNPRVERGNHVGLAIDRKSDVAHVSFVEDLVDGLAIVGAAMRFAHYPRTLGWRNGFGHGTPHGEAWRGVGRFATAHLIYSRRQSGMSEEQL